MFDWGSFLGAGISTAGNIYGQQQAQKHDEKLASQQRQWNLDMWNLQRSHALDMWNKQNEYNHPVEQMARMKEAGINPHMLFTKSGHMAGGPAAPVGNAGDVKGYSRAQSRNILQGVDTFGKYFQFKNLKAQTDNTEAQADFTRQKELTEQFNTLLRGEQAEIGKFNKLKIKHTLYDTIDTIRLQNQKMRADIRKLGYENSILDSKAWIQKETEWDEMLSKQFEYGLKERAWRKVGAEIRNLDADTAVKKAAAAYKEIQNMYAKGGVNFEKDSAFLRAIARDPEMQPYVFAYLATKETGTAIANLADFFKFFNVRVSQGKDGKIKITEMFDDQGAHQGSRHEYYVPNK